MKKKQIYNICKDKTSNKKINSQHILNKTFTNMTWQNIGDIYEWLWDKRTDCQKINTLGT